MPQLDYLVARVMPQEGWKLQWRFDAIDPSSTITPQRAASPEGPWTDLATISDVTTLEYLDDTPKSQRSLFTVYYYRLNVGGDWFSQPVTNQANADRVTTVMIKEHRKTLYGVNHHPGWYAKQLACFKRAIEGTPCPDCVDATGERIIDRCDTCGGTGYLEGWSNPITFRGRFTDPVSRQTIFQHKQEKEELTRRMWTAHYPLLEPGDVLVEKDTRRMWRVIGIQTSEPNDVVISQNAQLKFVDREYIEHDNLSYPDGD